MRFAVLGGDERQKCLVRMLIEDGHSVYDFALGNEGDSRGLIKCADAVILPLPAFRDGYLNAPCSDESYTVESILASLPSGVPVLGGMTDGKDIRDYYRREEFIIKNALITAECAVWAVQSRLRAPICGRKILICGYGRIGKFLSGQLKGMGADVTVSARKASDLAAIKCHGMSAVNTYSVSDTAGEYEVIMNTVPAPVIGADVIDKTAPRCLLVELASPPYGIDMEYAKLIGREVLFLPGLPGKMMPYGAAQALKETIYAMLEEENEQG